MLRRVDVLVLIKYWVVVNGSRIGEVWAMGTGEWELVVVEVELMGC